MAISFPANPTTNQTYSNSGVTWTYDGKKWLRTASGTGGATVAASDTRPVTTTAGSLWLDTNAGELAVYQGTGWVNIGEGSSGYTGSVGYAGSTGSTGYAGSRGQDGVIGYNGSTGYTGSVGGIGYVGSRGQDGVIGYNGSTGYTGSSGSAGGLGYTGSVGPSSVTAINDQQNTGTGALGLPVGTTVQRPATAYNGYFRINSQTSYVETYYNSVWYNLQYIGIITATGGTVTTSGNYKIHTFTGTSNFVVTDAPTGAIVEVLLIGGGGGGGTGYGGGGGGGGYYYNTGLGVTASTYTVTVGSGGTNSAGALGIGTNGSNTTFGILATAYGGGGGGDYNASAVGTAANGGSGGGGGGLGTSTANAGTALAGQGSSGGIGAGTGISTAVGGGGGGAGGAGGAATTVTGGAGGVGVTNPIVGSTTGQFVSTSYYFSGGGGGGGSPSGNPGTGGSGGGGAGLYSTANGFLPTQVTFSGWIYNTASVTNTINTAPDGTATASLINASASSWGMYYTVSGMTPGATYYFTVWVKLGSCTNFCVTPNNTAAWQTIAGAREYTSADGLNTSTWTKIVHTFVATSSINLHILSHSDNATQQTAGTIYLWAPMLWTATPTQAGNGITNTGGGGGGGGAWTTSYGGNGGSGVVIVRYRYQ